MSTLTFDTKFHDLPGTVQTRVRDAVYDQQLKVCTDLARTMETSTCREVICVFRRYRLYQAAAIVCDAIPYGRYPELHSEP